MINFKFFSLVKVIMIAFKLFIFISYFYFICSFKKQTPFLFLLKQNYHKKKIITLSPGGFRGFYVLGLCKYIKENYDLTDYVFSGASAGAWNSLFLSYNGSSDKFVDSIMSVDIKKQTSLYIRAVWPNENGHETFITLRSLDDLLGMKNCI